MDIESSGSHGRRPARSRDSQRRAPQHRHRLSRGCLRRIYARDREIRPCQFAWDCANARGHSRKKPADKKIIVASSQAVYSEGAGICPKHGLVFPKVRPIEQLRRGDWSVHCPICNAVTESAATPEHAPVGGETVYALTKVDQERLVLLWGKQVGIPTVALRYS